MKIIKTIRQIRKSSYKDYVAVDEVTDKGDIIVTPFYLPKNVPVKALAFDQEESKWMLCELIYNGEKVIARDIDEQSKWNGMEWDAEDHELIDKKILKSI